MRGRATLAIVVLVRDHAVVASWPLERPDGADLDVVDELSTMQLAARGAGCSIRLCNACEGLLLLIDLAGLADVLPAGAGLRGEVVGQTEHGEEAGVEEVVEPRDPIS